MVAKITLAQLNFTVGDISNNQKKIINAIQQAKDVQHSNLIIFPELAITSYPPEDLLHRPHLYEEVNSAITEIQKVAQDIDVLIGYPEKNEDQYFNAAYWMRNQKILKNYRKQKLPNYGVFDERRYFNESHSNCIIELNHIKFGVLICEDLWKPEPIAQAKASGVQCIICINASPYSTHKSEKRLNTLQQRIRETKLPIIYVNLVGGQDELVFDGDSFAMNANGEVCAHAGYFKENLLTIEIDDDLNIKKQPLPEKPTRLTAIYEALKLGVKDYTEKNNFPSVLIGLSGGIDSALTLAVAVDALGANKVHAVMMPSPYTSTISLEDAAQQAKMLGVHYYSISIESIYQNFLTTLNPLFHHMPTNTTEENIQARIRGTMLMALSNKFGHLVLTTGNKSEMAVGYSTLYGDMAGGFNVLKDVFKTFVYKLAKYRNQISEAIPTRVIDRPPSAELAPDQIDQDSLPPYDQLDGILKIFIEHDDSIADIVKRGFDEATVRKVVRMILNNEYKRRQSPPGIRISEKAFGKDRRYPITSGYLKNAD